MEPIRDLNLHPDLRRVPCLPRNREREKRHWGGRAKHADVQKRLISYIVILTRVPFGEWGVPRGVTQAGIPKGKNINSHPAVLVA